MTVKVIFAPEAEADLQEAYDWYENQRRGLGEEWFSAVEACVESIRRSPEAHLIVHEAYRRALLRRFPYAVFYEFGADSITIYGVMHTSRNPNKWRQRLI